MPLRTGDAIACSIQLDEPEVPTGDIAFTAVAGTLGSRRGGSLAGLLLAMFCGELALM